MSYKLFTIPPFERQLKKLSKRYPSIKNDLKEFAVELKGNPFTGTPIGNSCYKVRLQITSKGKGKSGGGRIITYVFVAEKSVFLLSVYDKSEIETISFKEIQELLKYIRND